MRRAVLVLVVLACGVVLSACTMTPNGTGVRPPDAPPTVPRGPMGDFELNQFQRAKDLEQKGQWAEAAWAWEVLTVLRPQDVNYRERLAAVQAQIEAGVADRLQKGQQAQARGDLEGASQHYLTALSLQPDNAKAADALRALEKERNKRSYLGTPSRITLRRGAAEGKPLTPAQAKAAAAREAKEAREAAAREAREAKEAARVAAKEAAAEKAAQTAAEKAAKDAAAKEAGKAAAVAKADGKDAAKGASAPNAPKAAGGGLVKEAAAAPAVATAPAGKASRHADSTPAAPDRNELEHIAMLSAQGEVDEAITLLERRSAQDRKDPSARRLLADLYVRKAERVASADRAGAIGWLQKCLKIDQKHPRALALMRQWIDAAAAPAAGSKTVAAAAAPTAGAAPKQMR